ncbi:MAG: hypothetical protein R2704_17415 [Microthrixaceae bacterium]
MTLQVELVSPEAIVWSGEANMVIARTLEGDAAFMEGQDPHDRRAGHGRGPVIADDEPGASDRRAFRFRRGLHRRRQHKVAVPPTGRAGRGHRPVPGADRQRPRPRRPPGRRAEDSEAAAALRRAEVRISVAEAAPEVAAPGPTRRRPAPWHEVPANVREDVQKRGIPAAVGQATVGP